MSDGVIIDPATGLRVLYKQPSETRVFHMNFANLLGSAEIAGVDSVTVVARGNLGAYAPVSVDSTTYDQSRVAFTLSGGTDGEDYKVTVRVASTDGMILEGEGFLYVRDW